MSSSKKRPVTGLCGRCLSVWGPEAHTPTPIYLSVHVNQYASTGGGGGGES